MNNNKRILTGRQRPRDFDRDLLTLLLWLEDTIKLSEAAPRCVCGETDNLTECRAIPDNSYYLCPYCLGLEMLP
jgi:hypothetical protein